MPLRIAIVNLHRGGMMHYAAGLARSLLAADARNAVAFHCPHDADTCVLDPRVEVFRYRVPQELRLSTIPGLLALPCEADRLRRRIEAWGPDLVHVNSGHIANPFFVPQVARRFPVVASIHDVHPHPGERRPVEWVKLPSLLKAATTVIVHGDELLHEARRRWDLPSDKGFTMKLVVGALPGSDTPDTPPEDGHLLVFGRLVSYKGYEVLSAALALAGARAPHLRVTVAGAGSLAAVRPLLARHPGRVSLRHRYIADAEIAPLFRSACMVVLPYVEASQSGVVHLAATFARPVVATRTGAIPEVVADGTTGLLVPPANPGELAQAIMRLLDDPALGAAMGAAAHAALAAPACYVASGRRLMDIYARALATPPGGGGLA